MSRFGIGEGLNSPLLTTQSDGMGKRIPRSAGDSVIAPDENTWFQNWAKTSKFVNGPLFKPSHIPKRRAYYGVEDPWRNLKEDAAFELALYFTQGGDERKNFYLKVTNLYTIQKDLIRDIITGLLGYPTSTQQYHRIEFRIYEYLAQRLALYPDGGNLLKGSSAEFCASPSPIWVSDPATRGVNFKTSWGKNRFEERGRGYSGYLYRGYGFNDYLKDIAADNDEDDYNMTVWQKKALLRSILILAKLASILEAAGASLQKARGQFAVELNKYLPGKIRLAWGDELSFDPATGTRVGSLNALAWRGDPLAVDKISASEGWAKGLEFLIIDLSTDPNYEPVIDRIRVNATVDIERSKIGWTTTDDYGNVKEEQGRSVVSASKLASISPVVLAALQKRDADEAAAAESAAAAEAAAIEEARLAEEAKIAASKRKRNSLLTLAAAGIGAYLYTKA